MVKIIAISLWCHALKMIEEKIIKQMTLNKGIISLSNHFPAHVDKYKPKFNYLSGIKSILKVKLKLGIGWDL